MKSTSMNTTVIAAAIQMAAQTMRLSARKLRAYQKHLQTPKLKLN